MRFIRSQSNLLGLLLLVAMFLVALDVHADCGDVANTPMATQHCCVQCCPSHSLKSQPHFSITLPSLENITIRFHATHTFHYQNPSLDSLYRPPIA